MIDIRHTIKQECQQCCTKTFLASSPIVNEVVFHMLQEFAPHRQTEKVQRFGALALLHRPFRELLRASVEVKDDVDCVRTLDWAIIEL